MDYDDEAERMLMNGEHLPLGTPVKKVVIHHR